MQTALPLGLAFQLRKEKSVTTSNEGKKGDSVIPSRSDGVGDGSCCTSAKQNTTDISFVSMGTGYMYLLLPLYVYLSAI